MTNSRKIKNVISVTLLETFQHLNTAGVFLGVYFSGAMRPKCRKEADWPRIALFDARGKGAVGR